MTLDEMIEEVVQTQEYLAEQGWNDEVIKFIHPIEFIDIDECPLPHEGKIV